MRRREAEQIFSRKLCGSKITPSANDLFLLGRPLLETLNAPSLVEETVFARIKWMGLARDFYRCLRILPSFKLYRLGGRNRRPDEKRRPRSQVVEDNGAVIGRVDILFHPANSSTSLHTIQLNDFVTRSGPRILGSLTQCSQSRWPQLRMLRSRFHYSCMKSYRGSGL